MRRSRRIFPVTVIRYAEDSSTSLLLATPLRMTDFWQVLALLNDNLAVLGHASHLGGFSPISDVVNVRKSFYLGAYIINVPGKRNGYCFFAGNTVYCGRELKRGVFLYYRHI